MGKVVSLSVLDGVGSIGGIKILVQDHPIHLLLDFGLDSLKKAKWCLQSRIGSKFADYLALRLLPKPRFPIFTDIYRRDYIRHLGLEPTEREKIAAVVLSNSDPGHSGCLEFLRGEIPVICSEITKTILEARDVLEAGENLILKTQFQFHEGKKKRAVLRRHDGDILKRPVQTEEHIELENMTIHGYAVDHSIPGSRGYILETRAGNIIYTGTLRKRGYRAAATKKFLEQAADAEPLVLIIEGTNADGKGTKTEQMVHNEILHEIETTEQLVLINFPAWDLERFLTVFTAAKEGGRILLISLEQAYLLQQLKKFKTGYPTLEDKHLGIYLPRQGWGLQQDHVYIPGHGWGCLTQEPFRSKVNKKDALLASDYHPALQDLVLREDALSWEDVQRRPSELVLYCNFSQLPTLLDISRGSSGEIIIPDRPDLLKIDERSKFIWSSTRINMPSVPVPPAVQIWLDRYDLPIIQAHASGSASFEEVLEIIDQISPRIVYPVHSTNPELFSKRVRSKSGYTVESYPGIRAAFPVKIAS